MNFERGFRRIIILLSIVIALTVWFWFSALRFKNAKQYQMELKQEAEEYRCFWDCWEADNFLGSKKRIITDFLRDPEEAKMVGVDNGNDIKAIRLYPNIVFPGIEQLRVHFDTLGGQLTPGILRISDSALEEAAQVARANCLALEPNFSTYFIRSKKEMITRSILEGIPVAVGAFIAVWLLFLIFKWISSGFCSDGANTTKTLKEIQSSDVSTNVADEYDTHPSTQEILDKGVCRESNVISAGTSRNHK